MDANWADVHEPVKIFPPVNVATDVVAIDIAASTVAGPVDPAEELTVPLQPIWLGIVTLTLEHWCTLNAKAAAEKLGAFVEEEYVVGGTYFADLLDYSSEIYNTTAHYRNSCSRTSTWHRYSNRILLGRGRSPDIFAAGFFSTTAMHSCKSDSRRIVATARGLLSL